SSRHHRKPSFRNSPFKLRVHFVIAEEFFFDHVHLVERMQIRSRANADFRNGSGKFWCVTWAIGYRTCNRRYDDVLRSGIVFGSISILDSQHISRTLYQSVLKPSSSADERPVAPAREFDGSEHSIETLVRTSRRCPQPVEGFQ